MRIAGLRRRGAGEFDDFPAYAQHVSDVLARSCALLGIVGIIVLWPTDLLIFGGDHGGLHTIAAGRAFDLLILGIGFWLIARRGRRGRDTIWPWISLFLLCIAVTYHVSARLGPPEEPWIHTALLVPILTVVLLIPLRQRIPVAAAAGMTPVLAYFGWEPLYLESDYVGVFFASLLSSCAISVTLGHLFYGFVHGAFLDAKELERVNRTDGLTGVHARAYVLERAREELARARRSGGALTVLLVDIDHFKRVNDTEGHAAGDAVLTRVAGAMASTLRETDLLGRIGGEEFLVLLPDTGLTAGCEAAERMRAAVATSAPDGASAITVSIGATARRDEDSEVSVLLRRADGALYRAKNEGRDRVVTDPEPAARS